MVGDYQVEYVNIADERSFRELETFLAGFDLAFDRNVEFTIAVRQNEKLIGTGSFEGEVLRNVAVDETLQGAGLTSLILTELMQEQARRGRMHYFVFTKPSKAHLFANLGFHEIARAEPYASLLETGIGSIETYCNAVAKEAAHLPAHRAAVVVNCNPFTYGHQALIKKAARENGGVIVFVVSEDKSLFPFESRINLVRQGIADLPNAVVVPAGKYLVSAATFPTYFTREENKVIAQTQLDVTLFAKQIAARLGITARYIGEEPYCPVTNAYNQAMQDILPANGIQLVTMDRITIGGEIVSASKVRDRIRNGDWESVRMLVPETTYAFLVSPAAKEIIERIQNTNSRH